MSVEGSRTLIVAVVPDLLIESRIEAAAQLQGLGVTTASVDDASTTIADVKPRIVVIDLATAADSLGTFKDAAEAVEATVVGYYPHVEVDLREAAREAGIERVYPRSRFLRELPRILAAALQP
jgi:hypothetical protein